MNASTIFPPAPDPATLSADAALAYAWPTRIALLDCNSFYASCEQAHDSTLRGRPVAVLSLNDGCVIAANREAKALGVGMGMVYHLNKDRLAALGVVVRSANFHYYARKSAEVMQLLLDRCPVVEVYSIDEAWLDLTSLARWHDLDAWMRRLRADILRQTGIPVGIGLGTSKVTAKLANRQAKARGAPWVAHLTSPDDRLATLRTLALGDVWGVAAGWTRRLARLGCNTAIEYVRLPDSRVQPALGIVGLRHVHALRGAHAMPLAPGSVPKKHIACTRSFRHTLRTLDELDAPLAYFTQRVCHKLQQQQSVAGRIQVYLRTDRFAPDQPQRSGTREALLPSPTAYPPAIFAAARQALRELWRPGYSYKKAGLLLDEIGPAQAVPLTLFDTAPTPASALHPRSQALLRLVAKVNAGHVQPQLSWAQLLHQSQRTDWAPRSEIRSDAPDDDWFDDSFIKPWW